MPPVRTPPWRFVIPGGIVLVGLILAAGLYTRRKEVKATATANNDHALQQLLDSLLQRYGFPPDLLTPEPHGRATRGNTTYYGFIERYRPAHGHIYHHTGHESLRGERSVSIIRKGPFAEEGSWLRER